MIYKSILKNSFLAAALIGLASTSFANGAANSEEPIELLIKFDITGAPSQMNPGAFTIGGPGYATVTTSNGAILDDKIPGLKRAELIGAEIQFQGQLTDPVVNFTCLGSSCRIEFDDGSVLESDSDNLPLSGRLAGVYGPVVNSEFNPPASTPIRILGCGGLKGTAGPMNGMVGAICFNGTFNVPDFQTNFVLTGNSNCTIVMHTPIVPVP